MMRFVRSPQAIELGIWSVYVAGPMRGKKDFNFPLFDETTAVLREAGYVVFNPAEKDREMHGDDINKSETGDLAEASNKGFNLREALKLDLDWIFDNADGICVLPDYEMSLGATCEAAAGRAVSVPVEALFWFVVPEGLQETIGLPDDLMPGVSVSSVGEIDPAWAAQEAEFQAALLEPPQVTDDIAVKFAEARLKTVQDGRSPNLDALWIDCGGTENGYKFNPELAIDVDGSSRGYDELLRVAFGQSLGKEEVRTTSSTGGQKGVKLARFDLIPPLPLWELAECYGRGAEKYAERNWENGFEWGKAIAAMGRHFNQFMQHEDLDPETGIPHLTSVMFYCMAMRQWARTHPEFDDRP